MNYTTRKFNFTLSTLMIIALILIPILSIANNTKPKLLNNSTISYQGVLLTIGGQPVDDGLYDMKFRLLADSGDTEYLWEELWSVTISDGSFSVYLGEKTALTEVIVEQANFLQIFVNDEEINPPTKLSATPTAIISNVSRKLKGDVITEGPSLFVPGSDPVAIPKVVELSREGDEGRLGIWGTGGTTMPQLELIGSSSGGQLGIWGTGGTTQPQVELKGTSSGGQLGIWGTNGTSFPQLNFIASIDGGHFVVNGVTGSDQERVEMRAMDGAASLGIWGTGGTTMPQVELKGTSGGGQLGIWGTNGTSFPQVNFMATADGGYLIVNGLTGSDQDRVEMRSWDGVASLGIWGTGGTTFPRLNLYSDSEGGTIVLRANTNDMTIMLNGNGLGDAAVVVPDDAISDSEILNEPGLAENRNSSCQELSLTSMVDITVVEITIPTDGYIHLYGKGMVEFSGTTSANRIDVQIDDVSGGGSQNGYFVRVGLAAYVTTSYSSFSFAPSRTYFKTAGTYTFILEAARLTSSGSASVCYSSLTAIFFPTSYGTVASIMNSSPDYNPDGNNTTAISELKSSSDIIDLRNLEIRARQAKQAALKAELDFIKAAKTSSNK